MRIKRKILALKNGSDRRRSACSETPRPMRIAISRTRWFPIQVWIKPVDMTVYNKESISQAHAVKGGATSAVDLIYLIYLVDCSDGRDGSRQQAG